LEKYRSARRRGYANPAKRSISAGCGPTPQTAEAKRSILASC
jgi:hypothetical protein